MYEENRMSSVACVYVVSLEGCVQRGAPYVVHVVNSVSGGMGSEGLLGFVAVVLEGVAWIGGAVHSEKSTTRARYSIKSATHEEKIFVYA